MNNILQPAGYKGKFIVIEGLEGAGKSTALATIQHFLTEHNISEVITTREPGGTHVGEVVRRLIKEVIPGEALDPRAELLLLYAARVQLIENVIRPALDRGCWVLADRFELSTLAYQGGGRKLDKVMIEQLSVFCLQKLKPDLILFLDVNLEQGLKRAKKRGKADRIEQESLAFFQAVYHSYHEHIKSMDNVARIDASQPFATVQNAIRAVLKNYITNLVVSSS